MSGEKRSLKELLKTPSPPSHLTGKTSRAHSSQVNKSSSMSGEKRSLKELLKTPSPPSHLTGKTSRAHPNKVNKSSKPSRTDSNQTNNSNISEGAKPNIDSVKVAITKRILAIDDTEKGEKVAFATLLRIAKALRHGTTGDAELDDVVTSMEKALAPGRD